jgi:hypothetical protein
MTTIQCEAFGDESVSAGGRFAIYSFVGFEPRHIGSANAILAGVKEQFGVPSFARFHCRVIFREEQRAKTDWRVLSNRAPLEFCRILSSELLALKPLWSYGYVDLAELQALPHPELINGKFSSPDGQSFSMEFREKQAQKFAYGAAEIPFVMRFTQNVRFWADKDGTKIGWFKGKQQSHNIHSGVGTPAKIELPEEFVPMLEIADLFAYAAGRHLSGIQSFGQHVFRTMHEQYEPMAQKMNLDPSLFGSDVSTKQWIEKPGWAR